MSQLVIEVNSYLGSGAAVPVPVVSGSWKLADESGVKVPGSIEFAVPATQEWIPIRPDHPLAGFGQRVRARVGWAGGPLSTWGWYRLDRPTRSGAMVRCTGRGLLREVERARLTQTWQTTTGQTRSQVAKALLAGLLPVVVASGVADAALPVSTWSEDRLAAFWEIVESWPGARAAVVEQTVQILPAWSDASPGVAVGRLATGVGGTLLAPLESADTGTDPYNGYVVSTVPEGDASPMTEFWGMPSGPMMWGGPYGQNPAFFSSPLNPSDRTQLQAIAQRLTLREVTAAASWNFQAKPDPSRRVGDVVTLSAPGQGVSGVGRIMSLALTRSALSGTVVAL